MYFDSFSEFLRMGTHGPYVWSAYGISLLLMAANIFFSLRQARMVREQIRQQVRREAAVNHTDKEAI